MISQRHARVAHRSLSFACVLIVVLLAGPMARPASAATPEQVDAAIARGKAYLFTQLKGDNWELAPTRPPAGGFSSVSGWQWGGMTGTALYGLLAAGENPQDKRIKPAIEWLKKAPIYGHYASSMRAQVWPFLKSDNEARTASRPDFKILMNGLIGKGPGLGFYAYYLDDKGQTTPPGWYDRSVSQISVLGMWACDQAGQEVPSEYWKVVDAAWKKSQKPDGGWTYHDDPAHPVSGTMTAAGIATLYITQDFLMQSEYGRFSACRGGAKNEAIERGLAWMDKNAPALLKNAPHYFYQMYGLERIGVASGRKYFGTTDWYRVGADELVRRQNPDGSWGVDDIYNPKKVADTVFSLLFLVRGRAPVIMNKLEYEVATDPAKKTPAVTDPWNQRPRDVANFTHWAGKSFEQYMNWQVVNLKVSAADLNDAPILYISGSLPLKFTADEINKLRQFVEAGGILLGNADCSNAAFAKSFVELGNALFPKYEFRQLPLNHPIFEDEMFKPKRWKVPPKVMGLSNGARELMLLIPEADYGKWWQLRSEKTKAEAYEVMADIFLYAVDKQGLQSRGRTHLVAADPKVPTTRTLSVARLIAGENADPEPGGWRRMVNIAHNDLKLAVNVDAVKLGDGSLNAATHKLAHLTGTAKFKLSDAQKADLRKYIEAGGTLLVDATGGASDFADSAERELAATFSSGKEDYLQLLPPDHPLFAAAGKKPERFAYRSFVRGKVAGGLNAPRLRAYVVGGRPAVLYSREDLSVGMVGQPVDGIIGYAPATATEIVKAIEAYVANPPAAPGVTTTTDPSATAAPRQ
jgi:hypothetical protein